MRFTRSVAKRRWNTVLVLSVAAVLVIPSVVWAADRFGDVSDSNVFHDDITWLADAGVTKGCNPPDNSEFCPSENVTREQMAAFLHRNAPVVTRLLYDGSDGGLPISSQYQPIRTVGTFEKVNDGTAIVLDWNAHADRTGGTFCEFQLRIDAANDNGDTSANFSNAGGGAVVYSEDDAVSVTALFTGLAAGQHQVAIWVRGDATSCGLNRGDFGQTVIVTETPYSEGDGSVG
jgi:hypothetical protein